MELFSKIKSRHEELYIKALCYDLSLDYSILYDKNKMKWLALKELSENQYIQILRCASDYFLEFERNFPSSQSIIKISA